MIRCVHCGRSSCRCGEPVSNRACSRHGATLKIISFAQFVPGKGVRWFEAAKCSVPGCFTVRNFDKGRGRKASPFIKALGKKFGAEIRAVYFASTGEMANGSYANKKQDSRPSASSNIPSNKKRKN